MLIINYEFYVFLYKKLKVVKVKKFSAYLFQRGDYLHQDFTNSLDVGTDAKDALNFIHQGQATHTGWGGGASTATREEGNNILDQRII